MAKTPPTRSEPLARTRIVLGGNTDGYAVLQAGMAELVNRSHSAQDVPFAGVIEETHEAQRSAPTHGELNRSERRRPGMWDTQPGYEPGQYKPKKDSGLKSGCDSTPKPVR
jgi:hypothetical protein